MPTTTHEDQLHSVVDRLSAAAEADYYNPYQRFVVHTHLGEGHRPKLFPSLQGVSAFVLWSGGAGMTESRLRTLVEASGLALDRLEPVRDSGTTLAVCRR